MRSQPSVTTCVCVLKFPPPLYKSGINLPCTDSSISGTVPCSKLKDYRFLPSLLSIFVYNIFALDNITSLCRQYQTFCNFNLNKRWSVTDYFLSIRTSSPLHPHLLFVFKHMKLSVWVCVSLCVCVTDTCIRSRGDEDVGQARAAHMVFWTQLVSASQLLPVRSSRYLSYKHERLPLLVQIQLPFGAHLCLWEVRRK